MAATRSDTRKEEIYRTASVLFSARGYQATSIRDIARELDLQGGSLYAHVASKEEVLWEIVTRAADAFLAGVRPIAESDAPPIDRLRAMIATHVEIVISRRSQSTVFFQDWQHLSPARRDEIIRLRDEYEGLFRRVIAEGISSGDLRVVDSKLTAIYLLSALNGIPGWYREDGDRSPGELARGFSDLLLSGVNASAGGDREHRQ